MVLMMLQNSPNATYDFNADNKIALDVPIKPNYTYFLLTFSMNSMFSVVLYYVISIELNHQRLRSPFPKGWFDNSNIKCGTCIPIIYLDIEVCDTINDNLFLTWLLLDKRDRYRYFYVFGYLIFVIQFHLTGTADTGVFEHSKNVSLCRLAGKVDIVLCLNIHHWRLLPLQLSGDRIQSNIPNSPESMSI